MSYVINNSRGQLVAVVPIGVVNTSATSLSLVGQGVTDYGTAENENYVYLLENFANSSAPNHAVTGQLWYNTETDTLSVWSTDSTWTALVTKAYVDAQTISPAFSGVPTAPTAASTDSSTQIATTAFVQAQKADPEFTGVPTAPTAASTDSSTQIATTAFVQAQKHSPEFTGAPTAPTASYGDLSSQLATTAFVQSAKYSPEFSGVPTAPTAPSGTANTQIATTAFVATTVANVVGTLGTIASQDSDAVDITGGTITGITDLAIADGGTGSSTAAGARANLGLGSMALQDSSNVSITGGTIANIVGIVPTGAILIWSGSAASVPLGWAVCNGMNGTPDLRNRFVMGASEIYSVGNTGGSANAVVVAHSHTAVSTVTDPGHAHSIPTSSTTPTNISLDDIPGYVGQTTKNTSSATTGISVGTTVNSTGVSGANANLPPYYVLCYIMKT